MLDLALPVLIWTCIVVFILTSLITLLAIVGVLRLGGGTQEDHSYYLRRLFTILILEIVGISVIAYAAFFRVDTQQVQDLIRQAEKPSLPAPSASRPTSSASTVSPSASAPNPPSPASNPASAQVQRRTIEKKVYATTDGPQSLTDRIDIPSGWKYVTHRVSEWTGRGSRRSSVSLEKDPSTQDVRALVISASVGSKELFGPRNWIGITVVVEIERPG